jgi:hypothetical protein
MKKYIVFLLFSFFANAQEKFVFNDGNIMATVTMTESDSIIYQKIEIENLTNVDIFVPRVNNEFSVYHYTIDNKLYSFNGIMNSLNGSPSLRGSVELVKIEAGKTEKLKEVNQRSSNKPIRSWVFTFDYVLYSKKIFFKNSNYWIDAGEYFKTHKYLNCKHIADKR